MKQIQAISKSFSPSLFLARVLLFLLVFAVSTVHGQTGQTPELAAEGAGDEQTLQSALPSPGASSAPTTSVPTPGKVVGTVTDANDLAIPGATVVLQDSANGVARTVTSGGNGFYEIQDVKPGVHYQVIVSAKGFAAWTSPSFVLEPGEYKILTGSQLEIEELETAITVSPETTFEISLEQVKVEEKQRAFGFIPNFFEVFDSHPSPLDAKLKFRLSFRVLRDPITFAGVGFLAGIGQAADSPDYRGGAKGYGERFAANYANEFTDIMIGGAILPSILRQDPRYYYQGTGTRKSRVLHAIGNIFITKGDNGDTQPNFSSLGGDLGSSAIANLYYPKKNRGAGLVFQNFGVLTAIDVGVRLMQEFVFHPAK